MMSGAFVVCILKQKIYRSKFNVTVLKLFDLKLFELKLFDLKLFELKLFDLKLFDLKLFDYSTRMILRCQRVSL